MTMVPAAQNHLSDQLLHGGYVGSCCGVGRYRESFGGGDQLMNGGQVCEYSFATVSEYSCLGSDLLVPYMAEDDSRTNSLNEEAGSSRDDGWLQLSIGGHLAAHGGGGGGDNKQHDQRDSTARRSSGLIELDLLPGAGSRDMARSRTLTDPIFHAPQTPANSRFVANYSGPNYNLIEAAAAVAASATTPSFFHHHGSTPGSSNFLQQEINWAFRPIPPRNVAGVAPVPSSSPSTSSASASSSSFLPVGRLSSYFNRPPLIQFQGSAAGVDVAGPSFKVGIINPPRRPHSGIWFTLKALENQAKEPFLPQISKHYLRIKDGKMTIGLVLKYVVSKLNLDSESEIEIRCRGQHLLPFLTLQHVRDSIWTSSSSSTSSSRDSLFNLLPHSSTTDHLMVLHYGRI